MSDEMYQPSAYLQGRAYINSIEAYQKEYERSIADQAAFW